MTILICVASVVIVAWLVWLFVSPKYKLPLLVDCGLALLALGVIALADGFARDTVSASGVGLSCAGIVAMLCSYVRRKQVQRYKRQRVPDLDPRSLRHVSGGRK